MFRTCSTCRQAKPTEEFAPHKASRDGRRPRCRACTRIYNRTWRERNLERCMAVAQSWKDANRERTRAYDRRRYAERPEAWAAKALRWYTANHEHALARAARWAQENPDRVRINQLRRKGWKRAAAGEATLEQVAARIAYFGGRCWMCGTPADAVDHVKPLSKGGSNWPANLRPACKSCNSSKKDRWPFDYRMRHRPHPQVEPSTLPP